MKKAFGLVTRWSARRPWLVLCIIAVLTVAAGVGAFRIRMEFSQESLLPDKYPSIAALREVEKDFGGLKYAKVLLTGPDLLSPRAALALYQYQEALEGEPGSAEWGDLVSRVESYLSFLLRNREARALMSLYSSLRTSASSGEALRAVREFLSSGEAQTMREEPEAAPLLQGLEAAVERGEAGAEAAEYLVETAISEALRRYLESAGSMVLGRTVTADGKAAVINIQVRPELPQPEALRRAGQLEEYTIDFFDTRGLQAEVSGEVYMMRALQRLSLRDSAILGIIALLFMVLVLFLTFRKVLDIFLTLAVVLVSVLWIFGIMGFAGIRYTVMGMALIPLMLGIDIAYSIHVLTRYYEERDKKKEAEDSAVTSVVTVGIAVFLAAATTMFGFLSFSISDLPPIRQFGFLCLGGVLFGFLLSITMLPAALVVRDCGRGVKETRRVEEHRLLDWLDRGLARLSLLAERHRLPVWIGCLVLVVACGLSVLGISTSADFRTFVPQDLPSYRSFTRIEEFFGGQDMTVALLKGEDLLSAWSLRKADEFVSAVLDHPRNLTPEGERKYFRPEKTNSLPGIFKALSALSPVGGAGGDPSGAKSGEGTGSGDWVPANREEAEALLSRAEEVLGFPSSSFITPDREASLVAFEVPFVDEEGEKEMASILRDAASAAGVPGQLEIRLTGMPLIISDALDKLFTTQLESGGLALLLCALLVMAVFRSMAYGISATSVVFLAILLEIGLLRLIGWPLDIMTVMIASLVIGAGIDFGIHVAHRFREELYENRLGPEEAVNATVRNVGNALISAAVTTSGAFLILAISSFSPLRRFGVVTALALISACFAALVLEPTFLTTVATRLDKRVRGENGEGGEAGSVPITRGGQRHRGALPWRRRTS